MKSKYTLKLTLGDTTLKSKGDTVIEALEKLPEPDKVFTKGDIELSRGKKHMKITWTPIKVRRLFWKISRSVIAKQFELLLR
jgi:hypothetical protein